MKGKTEENICMAGRVLLSDIARSCSTSISTVSRVLSGDSSRRIAESTRDRIIAAAREMGYFDAKLKTIGRSNALSVAVLFLSDHESILSPFFSQVVEGIKAECEATASHCIDLRVLSLYDDGFFNELESGSFDFAIILGRVRKDILDRVRRSGSRLIYAGLNAIGGMDEVLCDARQGISHAVEYLHSLGHERIAFLGPCDQHQVENEFRFEGYMDGLARCGISFDESLACDSYLTSDDGYARIRDLVPSAHPSAVICANDNLALGAIKGLADIGLSVPDDISVTGYDNIDAAAYLNPPLTTFDVPKRELGRFALRLAVERHESGRQYDVRLSLPFTLVKRKSTKEVSK